MMQQQICQPDQIGNQQAMNQQMVLCPVRFVYETQILVQPGEQIHPNQTIFINPQNPPPWMQNRTVSNQVVYVQQMPGNMMPAIQQQMDQNQLQQLYMQQNFVQMPQQMLTQNSELIRPQIQMANIMPTNMIQDVPNIGPSLQDRNVAPVVQQNFVQANTQVNQMNVINRQIMNNVSVNQSLSQNVNQIDLQRQAFMTTRPQMVQQVRPQITLPNQTMQNIQNLQVAPSIRQSLMQNVDNRMENRHVQMQNIIRNIPASNTQPIVKVEMSSANVKTVPNTINAMTNIRSVPYTYRPIQPRPNIFTNTAPNIQPIAQIPNMQVNNANTYVPNRVNRYTAPPNIQNHSNNTIISHLNRKRKSESPDDVQIKIAASSATKMSEANTRTFGSMVVKTVPLSNEIGVNTSPVHKIEPRNIMNQNTMVQMNANEVSLVKFLENSAQVSNTQKSIAPINSHTLKRKPIEPVNSHTLKPNSFEPVNSQILKPKPVEPVNNHTLKRKPIELVNSPILKPKPIEPVNEAPETLPSMPIIETEKFVRNTVYTQARGRLLSDKSDAKIVSNSNVTAPPDLSVVKKEIHESKDIKDKSTETKTEPERKDAILKTEPVTKTVPESIKPNPNAELKELKANIKHVLEKIKSEIEEKPAKVDNKNAATVSTEKNSKDFVLTHVLDGFVIQESNIAFPIRKPLKERTSVNTKDAQGNTKNESSYTKKEDLIEDKSKIVDVSCIPFHSLQLKHETASDTKEFNKEDSPFKNLQYSAVKSWNVEDLSAHLLKYDWTETVSVFQDHEIDGESLFLVSKSQLVQIGVSEDHADIICEFVKS